MTGSSRYGKYHLILICYHLFISFHTYTTAHIHQPNSGWRLCAQVLLMGSESNLVIFIHKWGSLKGWAFQAMVYVSSFSPWKHVVKHVVKRKKKLPWLGETAIIIHHFKRQATEQFRPFLRKVTEARPSPTATTPLLSAVLNPPLWSCRGKIRGRGTCVELRPLTRHGKV